MWSLPPSVRIFVYLPPADLRRSFNGLAGMVAGALGEDPLSGHLYVFHNRRADLIKILYWDRSGYCIWAKRLERGTFCFLPLKESRVEMQSSDLMLILEGIDLSSVKRRKRYQRPVPSTALAKNNSAECRYPGNDESLFSA
jgi:transposase